MNISADKSPCVYPFTYCEIHTGGNIFPCCPTYVDYKPLGNIFEDNLLEIWNGENYNSFRNKMISGDFSLCNRNICRYTSIKEFDEDIISNSKKPKMLLLTYDQECNYKCIMCRDTIITDSDTELEYLNNVFLPKISPFFEDLEEIILVGGEPLASRHTRMLIKNLCKYNPDINIQLATNGYFLNQENMDELGIKRLKEVQLSIHSATRKTYQKITRKDAFDRIIENLKFISEWKKQGKISSIDINFVVNSLNYKEMPDFVKMAKKYDVRAVFWSYKPWKSSEMYKKYDEYAVFEPFHKDYKKLKKILKNPIFKSEHCLLYPELVEIAESL